MVALDDVASLALFARVVHHRSFSAAAREAGIVKSAVSRRIAKLEARFGVRLLQRSTRRLSVTEEGRRLYEHAASIVAAATTAEEAVGATAEVRGTLRVNAPVSFAQRYLVPAIAGFLGEHPQVEVELTTDDRLVDVVESGFDVVVRIGRLADSGLTARKLAKDRLVVCAAPAYLAARGEPRSPADLAQHECLHYGIVRRADEWSFRGVVPPVRGRFAATNGGVLVEAAKAGLGLLVAPSLLVSDELSAGRLRLVLEGARRAEIGVYAVMSHRRHAPARTRAFVDYLAKHFARPAWGALVGT